MLRARYGSLDVRLVTGSSDARSNGGPLIVLLHGFGAPGDDLVPLSGALDVPDETTWAFVAAPLTLASPGFSMDSRAWWLIDMVALDRALRTGEFRDLSGQRPAGIDEAQAQLSETLEALIAELEPSRIILGGFSQGAMLALDVALHGDRRFDGLVLLSGTLLDEASWTAKMIARSGQRVFQSHGRLDPILPFALAERLDERLRSAGWDARFVPFTGAHEIPPVVLSGLQEFIGSVLD